MTPLFFFFVPIILYIIFCPRVWLVNVWIIIVSVFLMPWALEDGIIDRESARVLGIIFNLVYFFYLWAMGELIQRLYLWFFRNHADILEKQEIAFRDESLRSVALSLLILLPLVSVGLMLSIEEGVIHDLIHSSFVLDSETIQILVMYLIILYVILGVIYLIVSTLRNYHNDEKWHFARGNLPLFVQFFNGAMMVAIGFTIWLALSIRQFPMLIIISSRWNRAAGYAFTSGIVGLPYWGIICGLVVILIGYIMRYIAHYRQNQGNERLVAISARLFKYGIIFCIVSAIAGVVLGFMENYQEF